MVLENLASLQEKRAQNIVAKRCSCYLPVENKQKIVAKSIAQNIIIGINLKYRLLFHKRQI